MSHEWAGEGGVLDWQEEELNRMAGDNYGKREACKMAAWIKPKMDHKKMVQRLLQVKATIILCFRAEEKVKMEKDAQNKTVIVPIGWQPICEKNLPFELTVSFLLTPDKPGMPQPLKLQEQHKALFPLNKPINEESGKLVAEWAAGGETPRPSIISEQQQKDLWKSAQSVGITPEQFKDKFGSLKTFPIGKLFEAEAWIEDMRLARNREPGTEV
jgi:hypothetical protein